MCNDDHFVPHAPSRRRFLAGAGTLAGAALLAGRAPASAAVRPRRRLAAPPVDPWGNSTYSNAMHVHSSFSEYTGSMDAQLAQATLNSVDVLWWTDHAEHDDYIWCPAVLHCTGLSEHYMQSHKPWRWEKKEHGANGGGSGGGIVTTPCSPNDPVAGGALSVQAASTSRKLAQYGFVADPKGTGWHGNFGALTLEIDVMLEPGWADGYLEIRIPTSYHPAAGGNPAAIYFLSYRIVPSGSQTRTAKGTEGIMTIPVVADGQTWTTVTLTPATDIAALWPALDPGDFAFSGLGLYAASTGDLVAGYFDYFRFGQAMDGGELFGQQAAMMQTLAAEYTLVTQLQGLEVSLGLPHVNWFGSGITVPAFAGLTSETYPAWVQQQGIPMIHQAGGLASYNHPFGTSWTETVKPQATQDALLQSVASQLLPAGLYGADILEVGYPERAGVDLAHHVALWDILSRNAVFVTGNGTSDNHWGVDWAGRGWAESPWNWATSTWAASTAQGDLLAALAAGRVYCGSLAAPAVPLDLLVDSEVPMGAVSVSSLASRSLTLTAAGLPAGWSVGVLQGGVDYAGTSGLSSNAVQVGSFGSTDLDGSGQATMTLDTSAGSYVRTVVADPNGNLQALSNPVWLLQQAPPNGIPAPRQA